ncbi:MAG: nucleoside-diphosphate kinase [Bacteroidetes bacterium GWE2_29_8]|nr:MAG: nucleoside-diphosphate kinase [Bacteroidetes bacterium GWE2_29_8]OFY23971.1 MAG: nucleoside-diphosphate kinase [Bacteroidetes bacterium GWF2_29_10]
MENNFTFGMIKPTAFKKGYTGLIINRIIEAGFHIEALKMLKMSIEQANKFYGIHKGKPFFDDLIKFITSAPVIVMVLEKENAVVEFRELMGSTNPELAKDGTIRKQFATDMTQNAIHGSDSIENAFKEAHFFFSESEIFTS